MLTILRQTPDGARFGKFFARILSDRERIQQLLRISLIPSLNYVEKVGIPPVVVRGVMWVPTSAGSHTDSDVEFKEVSMKSPSRTFLLGMIWGALTSATVALLVAPDSGEETQEKIRAKVFELRDEAERTVGEGRESLNSTVEQVRGSIATWLDQGSELLRERAEEVRP
jgi:gas vesicle protein